jgi:hypothetical protein
MAIIKIGNNAVPASAVTQHASTFDDNSIKTNIALLGFKTAVNGSLAKYSLQDAVIDEFADSTGVNASSSTNETVSSGRVTGGAYAGTQTAIAQNVGTPIGDMDEQGGLAAAFDNTDHQVATASARQTVASSGAYFSTIGKDWGSGNSKSISKFIWHSTTNDGYNNDGNAASGCSLQLFGSNSNDFSGATALGSAQAISNARANSDETTSTSVGSGAFRYHWVKMITSVASSLNFCSELDFFEDTLNVNNLTLVSNSTTASSAPSKSDLIILMKNSTGTATINTDIKGFISRDNGSNFTEVTLVDEGSYGTDTKILVAHDVDISSQPSGTSMVYKITTLNQSGSKITDINAVSLGWK